MRFEEVEKLVEKSEAIKIIELRVVCIEILTNSGAKGEGTERNSIQYE